MVVNNDHHRREPRQYFPPLHHIYSRKPNVRKYIDLSHDLETGSMSCQSIDASSTMKAHDSIQVTDDPPPYREQRPGSIQCGICKKQFPPSRPGSLLAHLVGHFDMQYDFHRCRRCDINFTCERDLQRHLLSAKRHSDCGFMFKHKQPCVGHHPPRQKRQSELSREDKRRYSLMRHSDDARFDFCFRLRDWELRQLQTFYQRPQPSRRSLVTSEKRCRWSILVDVCKIPFVNRSKSWRPLSSEAPLLNSSSTLRDRPPIEITVPNSDVLGAMLLRAICTGSFELVASLLYAGANVRFQDSFGFGPMHYAARYASLDVARLLAQAGAYVDRPDDSGMSPVAHAVKIGRSDIVHCLLNLGAILHRNHLRTSISASDRDTADVLLDYWTRSDRNLDVLDKLLLTATIRRDRAMVKLLLTHGARALAEDEAGNNVMSIASLAGYRDIVQLLYDYGAELEYSDWVEKNLLWEAKEYRHIAMVEMLLAKGR